MYNAEYFFVDNPLNRYNLSQRNALKPNPDGSVDLYIQKESPDPDKERNRIGFPLPRESSSDDAAVLADGERPVDPRWLVEASSCQAKSTREIGEAKMAIQ